MGTLFDRRTHGTKGISQRHGIRIEAVARPYRWNKIPNRGGRTLIGGTGYDVKLGPQKRTFTLTLPDVVYCSGAVQFSDGTNSMSFAGGTQTREFEPGATVTIPMYYSQSTITITLYDNGTLVGWNEDSPYTFVEETDCRLTASWTTEPTFGVSAMVFQLRH